MASLNHLHNCEKYKIYGYWKMGSKVILALFQWSSSFFLHLQIDFLIYREQNKMTFMKYIIVILAFLVSRVAGVLSADEDTSSRNRIESVSRNFEKYWITSKGRNKQLWEYEPYYIVNLFLVTACPKSHHKSRRAGRRCCSNRNGCVECPYLSQGYRCQNYYDS